MWPTELSNAIRGVCGPDSFATAYLQPLTEDDVDTAAESTGIDPNAFRAQIEKARAQSLARQPLTLAMLLGLSKDDHGLPSTLKDLFDKGVRMLARDAQHRHKIDTQIPLPPDQIVDVAERLACYTVLTGRETVNLGDDVAASQLGLQELSGRVAEDELQAVGSSGLCDSGAPETFRFAHRQFAEYLAGRRLARLPVHQSRAFLAGPDGWRSGTAGPLRETAAFAAMFNTGLAEWLSSRDPEVVGLSDVADDALRRHAALDLLGRFRDGTLTAGELYRGGMELSGFQYEGAETDLYPVLTEEKGDRCEHVQACAISMIESWRLSSMSDVLADVTLDPSVPLDTRVSAGRALLECGTVAARERLKPLVGGLPEDEQDELKGVALQCNWPDRLSAPELFNALTPRRHRSFLGAYTIFLYKLDADGFPPTDHVAAGLRWAKPLALELNDADLLHRLCLRIAHAALRELDDPVIADGLMSLMRHWMRFARSPLAPLQEDALKDLSNDRASLSADRRIRRQLIDRLAEFVASSEELRTLACETPGLLHKDDFQWLLRRGCDGGRMVDIRERYLEIAALLPGPWRTGDVEAWLRVCDLDPVKKVLGNQKLIDLDSEQAARLRDDWKHLQDRKRESEPPELDPPPRDRVLEFLALSETKDVNYFPNLCRELTLEPRSTHYGVGRFLMDMPGWREADPGTRTRIVEAAKRYLSVETIAKKMSSKLAPNTHHVGGLDAIWLVLDRDPDWLSSRPESWWNGWCRYILAESVPNMHGEPADPKLRLVTLLNGTIPSGVCREVLHLLSSNEHHQRLSDALRLLADQANTRLDEKLCEALEGGKVQEGDIADVAGFVLRRSRERSLPVCLRILENGRSQPEGALAERVAVALFRICPDASWTDLSTYLDGDADRARRVLEAFAYDDFHGSFIARSGVSTRQLGELAGILLDLFPPDSDEYKGGVVKPVDAVHLLRTQVLSHLDSLRDEQSVDAFRRLEKQLGDRYPWLVGARIHAERAYRRTRWSPFPVDVVADVMDAGTRRLLRSDGDVVDGIVCALEQYAEALRQDGMESVEDLWNTATGAAPSPKEEEHVSRKVCGVVESYFREFAVAADREVEIHRRSVSPADGGQSGSKVDILVRVPGRGTTGGGAIRVPIEVKLSSNRQAKTGMKDQLVDRYMPQLGATHGLYVVVWMTTPNPRHLQPHHRPKWSCIEEARRELEEEARLLSEERQVQIRALVVDGSLR